MKKVYLLLLTVGLFFASCNEDALDLQPLDAISETDVFNDVNLLTAYVNASYAWLPNINRENVIGTEALTDLISWKLNNGHGVAEYVENRIESTNGESTTRGTWNRYYDGLRHVNSYFAKIENSSLPASETSEFTAQMHFLRAYYHFELLSWYGGIPIMDRRMEISEENFDISRNSVDEVVAFVVSELDAAIPNLKDDAPKARASKAAAMALKGRTLLYAASPLFNPSNDMAKWNAAAVANKAVMDLSSHPMSDDYGAIFEKHSPLDDEIIFTREYNQEVNQGGWSGINTMLWPNGYAGWALLAPTQEFVNMYETTDGELPMMADGVTPNPSSIFDPQDPYVNRDPRFYATILYNGAPFKGREVEYFIEFADDGNGVPGSRDQTGGGLDTHHGVVNAHEPSKTNYAIRKNTDPSQGATVENPTEYTPDIKFRKTEFYLNYAETQIFLGNEDEARTAINAVRARTGVNMPPITATGDDLVKAYYRERAVELFMEGHRFNDIRRWKIASDVMGKLQHGVDIEKRSDGTLVYSYGTKVVPESSIRAWDDKLLLLPIPDSEIKATNNAMGQNPGY